MPSVCASSPFRPSFPGVADLKKIFAEARTAAKAGQQTLLFVDEVHRFNRSQQDGFLPYVEDGTVTLVGATTENPSFEINAALLSRCQVLILRRLDHEALGELVRRAEAIEQRPLPVTAEARDALIASADGDGRFLLNQVETLFSVEIQEPLGRPSSANCFTAGSRSTTRTARAITISSPRFIRRSAAPTRRPRFIISRECSLPARSRSTFCEDLPVRRSRTSAWPIQTRCFNASRPRTRTIFWDRRKASWRSSRPASISRQRLNRTRPTWRKKPLGERQGNWLLDAADAYPQRPDQADEERRLWQRLCL